MGNWGKLHAGLVNAGVVHFVSKLCLQWHHKMEIKRPFYCIPTDLADAFGWFSQDFVYQRRLVDQEKIPIVDVRTAANT